MSNTAIIVCCLMLVTAVATHAQPPVLGTVSDEDDTIQQQPLVGANVYWLGTTTGSSTDQEGHFSLPRIAGVDLLVVSFIGYRNDTIRVGQDQRNVNFLLKESFTLEGVVVKEHRNATTIDYLNPIKSNVISEKELQKAACCNLSESFETNPSVDVSFTDAVTGTRQIQMLGLAGPYTQITRENIPSVRGLSAIFGMTYIPGSWIESIQLNKGAGSVVNGFESVAGQINVELRKPQASDKLFVNLYANTGGRLEGNVNISQKVNDKWATALLLHSNTNWVSNDRNNDSFLDTPLRKNFIALNRWKYTGEHGLHFQLGIKATVIDNTGGQVGFDDNDNSQTLLWGMVEDTKRYEGWIKWGKVFPNKPWKSIGFQLAGVVHNQNSNFGIRKYSGKQESVYTNLVYQSILATTDHKVKMGTSLQYDNYKEYLDVNDKYFITAPESDGTDYSHKEIVPGVFFEYSYSVGEQLSLMAGLRADYHNVYGLFVTPRLHTRYALSNQTTLRASVGRGQRTAQVIAENIGILASARTIIINSESESKPYGLNPEVAWNYGISLAHDFTLDYRDGVVSVEYYFTNFQNQVIVNLDQNPQQAVFSNLNGTSYANSLQFQLDYEVIKWLDMRLGYRWFDVQATYAGVLRQKPMMATHRAFANWGYETRNGWKLDYTFNWQGEKRLPSTIDNPEAYQLSATSPHFYVMNAQVTKGWKQRLELYVGIENILDYTQDHPIVSSNQPFGSYFDASMVWGPIFGRITYIGLRYSIP